MNHETMERRRAEPLGFGAAGQVKPDAAVRHAAEIARRHRIAKRRLVELSDEIASLGGAPATECLYAAALAGIAALEARARSLRDDRQFVSALQAVREGRS